MKRPTKLTDSETAVKKETLKSKTEPKPKEAPRGVGGVYELVNGVRVKKEGRD